MSDMGPVTPEVNAQETMGRMLDGKQAQRDVNYRPAQRGDGACGACTYFMPPNECQIVAGRISPDGVCDLFEPEQGGPAPGGPMPGGPAGGGEAPPTNPPGGITQ